MGRREAGGGHAMLWAMFYGETLGLAVHVDIKLTRATHSVPKSHCKRVAHVHSSGIQ